MPFLLLEEVLLLSVYPGLLLSPFVTVGDILDDEFEESFGEVVKFLDGFVLDLEYKRENIFREAHFYNGFQTYHCC